RDLIDTKQQQLSAIVNTYQALGGGAYLSPIIIPQSLQSDHKKHFLWSRHSQANEAAEMGPGPLPTPAAERAPEPLPTPTAAASAPGPLPTPPAAERGPEPLPTPMGGGNGAGTGSNTNDPPR